MAGKTPHFARTPAEFNRAIARRRPLYPPAPGPAAAGAAAATPGSATPGPASATTDACRLVAGAADGFPGLELDDFAGRWLAHLRAAPEPPWLAAAAAAAGARALYRQVGPTPTPPAWVWGEPPAGPFVIGENGARYWIDLAQPAPGLFLDQRDNRRAVRALAAAGVAATVLNTFAYTCGFAVAAGLGGAATTNIDLARPALDWGRRNCELNGIPPERAEFLRGDVFDWCARLGKRGRRFDLVILDPPTFSRDRRGRVFTVEKRFPELVRLAAGLLAPGGRLLCTSNLRRLTTSAFRALIVAGLEPLGRPAAWELAAAPMPPDFPGEPFLKTFWVTPGTGG